MKAHSRRFISWLIVILFIFVSLGCGSGGGGGGGSDDPPATDDDSEDDGSGGGGSTQTSLTGDWIFVDGDGSTGINVDTNESAATPHAAALNSQLYIGWHEATGGTSYPRVAVKQYDGSVISDVSDDIRRGSGDTYRSNPKLIDFKSKLHVVWVESISGNNRIVISSFDGFSWNAVDSTDDSGLNYSNAENAESPNATVLDSKLYVAWTEEYEASNYKNVRVKEWNDTDWTFIDGNAPAGLNYDSEKNAFSPILASYNSKLCAIWYEENSSNFYQIRVKQWDTTNWSFVDSTDDTGLNYNTSTHASDPHAVVFNSKLYVTWQESASGVTQIRVKEWDGTNWAFVDGNGSTGLNFNTSKNAYNPRLAVYDSRLYATWHEVSSEPAASPPLAVNSSDIQPMASAPPSNQIRVKVWNGGDEWSSVDGGGTTGINKSSDNDAENPFLVVYDSELYNVWQEETSGSTPWQIRAARADEN